MADCNDNNIQGNLSTIILFIYIIISPYLTSYGISQSLFVEFSFAIVGLIIAIWSAYNPNTFKIFGNDKKCQCACNIEEVVDDEYISDDKGC